MANPSPLDDDLTRWLFEESKDGLILFEPQSLRATHVNKIVEVVTARAASELFEISLESIFEHSATRQQFVDDCRGLRSFSTHDLRLRRPDHTSSIVSLDVRYIQSGCGTSGLLRLQTVQVAEEKVEFRAPLNDTTSELSQEIRDRQQRLKTAERLRESEERFRTIFEQAAVGVALVDTSTGQFVRINRRYAEMLGYSPDEMIGMTPMEITSVGLQDDLANMQKLREGRISEFTMEKSLVHKDGFPIWVNLTVSPTWTPLEEPHFHIEIVEEISEWKRIERALRKSERSLAKAQEIARLGNWELDLENGTVVGSAEAYRMLGIAEEDAGVHLLANAIEDYVHPDDRDAVFKSIEEAISNGQPKPLEFRHVSLPSGSVRYLRAEAEMLRTADGDVSGMFGTLQDVTEQKEVELALRESENKFRVIAESCPAMVAIMLDGKIEYANHMLWSILGYTEEEISKIDFLELVDREHRNLVKARNQSRVQGDVVPSRYEFKLTTKAGVTCWIDFTASLIEYKGKTAVLGIALDITERRMTEERLHQRETELAHVSRLTTMGEMVAGIAHEINQPLSAIANFANASVIDLEKLNNPDFARIEQRNKLIGQQAVRCGDIIRQLRDYVRQKKLDETSISVNDVIRESIDLLRYEFRKNVIDIECEIADASLMVLGNQIELQQVLVNLLANAYEAMTQSAPRRSKLSVCASASEKIVRIDVEDNGPGIRPGDLAHLFDAFFTTKSGGIGMGLAISRSIVERHNGRLWAENRRPSGAVFHLELPLA